MNIAIATKNSSKIKGAQLTFEKYFNDFDLIGISCPSDVPEQPLNGNIYLGAKNRINNLMKHCKKYNINADYFLGIESGLTNLLGKWLIINVAVIKDKNGYESWGTSQGFPVPDKYVKEITTNTLGKVMDRIFNSHDLRSHSGDFTFNKRRNNQK